MSETEDLPYRELVEQAGDAIFVADAAGRFTAANARALEMLGYTEAELLTKRIFDLHPPEDLRAEPLQLARMNDGAAVLSERRLIRKDGSIIEVELSARRLADGRMFSIVRDITARKQSARALAESEERYRQIFETNPGNKLVIDPETGRIVDANRAAAQFYGYSREALVAKRVFDLNTLPEDEVRARMRDASSAGRLYFVFEHRLADSRVRNVEIYTGPITLGGKTLLHSIVHDVTERRVAEEKLRWSEQYYRSLIENMSDLILIVGPDAVVRFVSPSIRRILGYAPEELIGAQAPSFMHPDEADAVRKRFEDLIERPGLADTAEVRLRHKDGTWRHMESTVTNLLANPAVGGVVVNSRDITARVAAENALRERTDELERLNQFMVDRELRMIELKREVAALKKALGGRDEA